MRKKHFHIKVKKIYFGLFNGFICEYVKLTSKWEKYIILFICISPNVVLGVGLRLLYVAEPDHLEVVGRLCFPPLDGDGGGTDQPVRILCRAIAVFPLFLYTAHR